MPLDCEFELVEVYANLFKEIIEEVTLHFKKQLKF